MLGPGQRQVRMIISVVPNLVPFVDNSPDESGVFFSVYSNQKEGGLRVRRFQNVQDLWRPLRIGTIVKRDRDLVLTARALMIQRRELWKFCVFRGEIAFSIDCQLAHPIGAIFIHGHDLPFADVGDCVGPFQHFKRFARLIVDLEIFRNSQRIPDRGILRAKTIEREAARFLAAHFAQFV